MSFVESITSVLSQYANFNGRARRSEYWYYMLAYTVTYVILSVLGQYSVIFTILSGIFWLGFICPSLAVAVRRLHDIGKSGWYYLFALIPLVGSIILLIWFATDSEPGDNVYGPNPKGIGGFQQSYM